MGLGVMKERHALSSWLKVLCFKLFIGKRMESSVGVALVYKLIGFCSCRGGEKHTYNIYKNTINAENVQSADSFKASFNGDSPFSSRFVQSFVFDID